MICGSIYKIQFPNGKHYIGITTISLKNAHLTISAVPK